MAIVCRYWYASAMIFSIWTYASCTPIANKKNEDIVHFENNSLDITMMQTKNEKFLIYRNTLKKECYVEQLTPHPSKREQKSRTLYVGDTKLTESDSIYKELGSEVTEICKDFSILILKEQPPFYEIEQKHLRRRRRVETQRKSRYTGTTLKEGGVKMAQSQSPSNNSNCIIVPCNRIRIVGPIICYPIVNQSRHSQNNGRINDKQVESGQPFQLKTFNFTSPHDYIILYPSNQMFPNRSPAENLPATEQLHSKQNENATNPNLLSEIKAGSATAQDYDITHASNPLLHTRLINTNETSLTPFTIEEVSDKVGTFQMPIENTAGQGSVPDSQRQNERMQEQIPIHSPGLQPTGPVVDYDEQQKSEYSTTEVSASGIIQAHVSGTYTMPFSGHAQTKGNEKPVQAQIDGNWSIPQSSSKSAAGKLQSQSHVSYNYENASFLAENQNNIVNYRLNGQIISGRINDIAKIQSIDLGSALKQVRVGVSSPNERNQTQQSVFEKNNETSSQNRGYSENMERQFHGSLKSNLSLAGDVQANARNVSKDKNVNHPNFNNFDFSVEDANKQLKDNDENNTSDKINLTLPLQLINKSIDPLEEFRNQNPIIPAHPIQTEYENDESAPVSDDETSSLKKKQIVTNVENSNSFNIPLPSQMQNTHIRNRKYDIHAHSPSRLLNPEEMILEKNNYRIPTGFRGKIKSTAGDKIEMVAAEKNQAQTLKLGTDRANLDYTDLTVKEDFTKDSKISHNNHVTAGKSETGKLAHTYHSKLSSCGYVTFTCELINDRTKICKDGVPTYADGTPC